MAKKALGKGLGAIISTSSQPVEDMERGISESLDRVVELSIREIKPNPHQPRLHFDESEIHGLAESIQQVGLIQPIIVRKDEDSYYIIAGERRWRACKKAGIDMIKAIIMEAGEEMNLSLALIENLQRADLDPIEEARAYKMLSSRFKLKQAEIAERVGKDRASVSNMVRLLNLPEHMQEALSNGEMSTGHAKLLLSLSGQRQEQIFNEILSEGLSVRALEKKIEENSESSGKGGAAGKQKKDPHVRKMEEMLISLLGTKVEIRHQGTKGRIEIHYYSLDDFDRITGLLKDE